jgi:hypothetical protein
MTSWMPDLDGSAALLAELRGDPCFTETRRAGTALRGTLA